MYIYDISLNSSSNVKIFQTKLQRKLEHTFYVQLHFSKNANYEIIWNIWYSQTGHRQQYSMQDSRIQTHACIIKYLLLLHGNNSHVNMPQHCLCCLGFSACMCGLSSHSNICLPQKHAESSSMVGEILVPQ